MMMLGWPTMDERKDGDSHIVADMEFFLICSLSQQLNERFDIQSRKELIYLNLKKPKVWC